MSEVYVNEFIIYYDDGAEEVIVLPPDMTVRPYYKKNMNGEGIWIKRACKDITEENENMLSDIQDTLMQNQRRVSKVGYIVMKNTEFQVSKYLTTQINTDFIYMFGINTEELGIYNSFGERNGAE